MYSDTHTMSVVFVVELCLSAVPVMLSMIGHNQLLFLYAVFLFLIHADFI